jgi:hypothetical protein
MNDGFMVGAVGVIAVLLVAILIIGLSESRSHRRERALAVRRKDKHRL